LACAARRQSAAIAVNLAIRWGMVPPEATGSDPVELITSSVHRGGLNSSPLFAGLVLAIPGYTFRQPLRKHRQIALKIRLRRARGLVLGLHVPGTAADRVRSPQHPGRRSGPYCLANLAKAGLY